MSTTGTWRTCARRTLAVLVSGVLATGGVIAATGPAMAAEGAITDGTLDWGVKESFRNYIAGPIAHGSIEVVAPATQNEDGTFRFAEGSGSVSEEAATLEFAGDVHFTGHDGLLDFTVSDPRVVVDADGAQLVVDAVSKALDSGDLVEYPDTPFADLDLTLADVQSADGVVTLDGVAATLTEEGAPAFAGFYAAGTELDAVSLTATVEPAAPEEVAPAITTQPEPVTVTEGADATFTAAASGTPEPTVQWQSLAPGAQDWTDIDAATLTTLQVTATTVEQDGTQYRAVFTNPSGSATTDAAALMVTGGEPDPVWEPEIEVFEADGVTPVGDTVPAGTEVVVKGSGFDPAANVGGRGVPIPAHLPQGTYVVFGKFADQWRPSEDAPSSARTSGAQKWALAESVLDQVPPQYQETIRGQWADLHPDGTFETTLTVDEVLDRDGNPVEGTYGVYTYGAGGVTNADQELAATFDVDLDDPGEPDGPSIQLSTSDGLSNVGGNVVEVTGSGFAPQTAVEVVQAVRVAGTDPITWPKASGEARVMTTADGTFIVPPSLREVTSRFVPDGSGEVYDCRLVECVVLAYNFGDQADRSQDAWVPISFDDTERPAPSVTLDTTEFPADGGSTGVTGTGFVPGDEVLVVQTTVLGDAADPRELPRNPAGTGYTVPGDGDQTWVTTLSDVAPVFTTSEGETVDCRAVECAVAVFPDGRADLDQSVFVPITFADDEPPVGGDGYLDWGVKQSFRNYIVGPIAHGSIEVREPATQNEDSTFRFAPVSGTVSDDAAVLEFAGEVYFQGHDMGQGPLLQFTVTDPRVVVDADGAQLVVDAVSKSLETGELVEYDDTAFADLGVTLDDLEVTDGVVTLDGVAATLTTDGAPAFAGFYPPGTELDPVSLSAPVGDDPGEPEPTPTVTVSETADLDAYGDAITVTGTGFDPEDLADGVRVGVGVVTEDGTVPDVLDPEVVVTPASGPLRRLAAIVTGAAVLDEDGSFEVELVTGAVEPGSVLAVYTTPVDTTAPAAYTTTTEIAFAAARTPSLTVTPSDDLADGDLVEVTGTGYAPNRWIYVAQTPQGESGAGTPSPFSGSRRVQAGPDGTFTASVDVAAAPDNGSVDCAATACYVASFVSPLDTDNAPVDYRADRSQDVFVPITFADDGDPDPEPVAPEITTQPESVAVDEGADASFTAAASGTPAPSVRWQVSAPGSPDWTDVADADQPTLTVPAVPLDADGTRYRAVFVNEAGTAESDAATLTVTEAPDPGPEPTVTVDPESVAQGDTLTIAGSGFEPGTTVEAIVDAAGPVEANGTLDWGVKESFRNYIVGPIAHGSIEVFEPATTNDDGTFRFGSGLGSGDTDEASTSFLGEVRFAGHDMGDGPLLEMTVAQPRVEVSGTSGILVADVVSRSLESSELVTYDDVEVADLDLSAAPLTLTDGVLSATDVPATLTADGVPAFAGFYTEGQELDPVSFSVEVDATATMALLALADEAVTAGSATVADDGTVAFTWTVPTDFATGRHTVDVVADGASLVSAAFTVTAADPGGDAGGDAGGDDGGPGGDDGDDGDAGGTGGDDGTGDDGGSKKGLPDTGADTSPLIVLAALLAAGGAAVTLLQRRRQQVG